MTRIDATRGRVPGVRRGGGPVLQRTGNNPVIGALGVAAGQLERREVEAERDAEIQQARADQITIAREGASFRAQMTELYDQAADGYDGASPGFAEGLGADLDRALEDRVAQHDGRYADQLTLHLTGVRNSLYAAADRYEREQQEAYVLGSATALADDEAKTVFRDPSQYGQAVASAEMLAEALPAVLRDPFLTETRAGYALSALAAYEQNDPATGLRMLQEGLFDEALDSQGIVQATTSLEDEIVRREARAQREAAQRQQLVARQFDVELEQIETARESGLPVSGERWQQLLGLAAELDETRMAEAQGLYRADRVANNLKGLPLAEARAEVDQMRAQLVGQSDVSSDQIALLTASESVVSGMQTSLTRDPVAFYMSQNEDMVPLSLDARPQALKDRVAQVEERAAHYGVPVRYFSENERAILLAEAERDPTTAMDFMDAAALVARPGLATELAGRDSYLGHGAQLLARGGSRAFLQQVTMGAARREQGQPRSVHATEGPAHAHSVLAEAMVAMPEYRLGAIEMADLAYDAASARLGRGRDDFDVDEYEQLLLQAVGSRQGNGVQYGGITRVRHGGRRRDVLIPSDLTPQQFERGWDRAPDALFEEALSGDALTADGRPIPVSQLRRALPIQIRPDEYALELSPGVYAPRADGQPVTVHARFIRAYVNQLQQGDQ